MIRSYLSRLVPANPTPIYAQSEAGYEFVRGICLCNKISWFRGGTATSWNPGNTLGWVPCNRQTL